MTIVKTKVHAGRVELAAPVDWPNGLEVEIRPVSQEDDLLTPDEIATTLAAMRSYLSIDEDAETHKITEEIIQERKQREKANFQQHMERLKKGINIFDR